MTGMPSQRMTFGNTLSRREKAGSWKTMRQVRAVWDTMPMRWTNLHHARGCLCHGIPAHLYCFNNIPSHTMPSRPCLCFVFEVMFYDFQHHACALHRYAYRISSTSQEWYHILALAFFHILLGLTYSGFPPHIILNESGIRSFIVRFMWSI